MSIRIKDILKNQQGSSLAFVLIIGMIIMIMVASLLAVANSDFTFTQETVESRQAYIDAKSVIEFGKIEINSREKELAVAYQALVAERNKEKPSATTIQRLTAEIAALETEVTSIYGNETNPAGTLSFSNDSTKTMFGKVSVEKSATAVNTIDTSQYIFKVETENLRRKLDYQVDYNYVMTTTPGSSGSLSVPTRPIAPQALATPNTNTNSWINTHIYKEYSPNLTKCIIDTTPKKEDTSNGDELNVNAKEMSLYVQDFQWANVKKLVLNTKNVAFNVDRIGADQQGASFNINAVMATIDPNNSGEIRFKKDFNLTQKSKMSLTGENIIFDGDLTIEDDSGIEIECENLWIKGDFTITTNNKDVINKINAKNVIIGDYTKNNAESKLEINGASNVTWLNLENLWIKGNFNLNNWNSNNEIQNIINAKNIIINDTQNKHNGELQVNSHSRLNLTCTENFWVGNVKMEVNDSNLTSTIKAKQIIIEDTKNRKESSIFIKDKTNVVWDASNFWVDGKIKTNSTSATQIFRNINYMNSGDIELDDKSQLTIEGADGQKNQLIVGMLKVVSSNNVDVNISKFCYITCDGLDLNDNSRLNMNAGAIKINGDFELSDSGRSGENGSLEIACEYFKCIGKTTIAELNDDLNFNSKNNKLNLWFHGGYQQDESIVNINGADIVIFGPSDDNNGGGNDGAVELEYDTSLHLNIKSDQIYFGSDDIEIEKGCQFIYEGRTTTASNIYIESQINKHDTPKVNAGSYINVPKGTFPEGLTGTGAYVKPEPWPEPLTPSCIGTSGGSTVTISPGTEKYY